MNIVSIVTTLCLLSQYFRLTKFSDGLSSCPTFKAIGSTGGITTIPCSKPSNSPLQWTKPKETASSGALVFYKTAGIWQLLSGPSKSIILNTILMSSNRSSLITCPQNNPQHCTCKEKRRTKKSSIESGRSLHKQDKKDRNWAAAPEMGTLANMAKSFPKSWPRLAHLQMPSGSSARLIV